MSRIALFVVSLAMLTGGALAAQSAIRITQSVYPEPAPELRKRNKIVHVVHWDDQSPTRAAIMR